MVKAFLLDRIITASAVPLLKAQHFRKRGRSFYRYREKVFHSIHFYSSTSNSEAQAVFTLQIAATLPERHPKPPEQMITDLVPIVGARFGPDNTRADRQFWISDRLEQTSSEVVLCLTHEVLPFLDAHSNEESLREIWNASGGVVQLPTLKI